LTPLSGMPLTSIMLSGMKVSDLSPLRGAPLRRLEINSTVSDLSPLQGMPLRALHVNTTKVADLSPLKGAPLEELEFAETAVTDLEPLRKMQLGQICFTPANITNGIEAIRTMKTLVRLKAKCGSSVLSPAEFWKKYDAGEFSK